MKTKKKSNWMRGFVIPPRRTDMDYVEAERRVALAPRRTGFKLKSSNLGQNT
jgi:hypothetical protein